MGCSWGFKMFQAFSEIVGIDSSRPEAIPMDIIRVFAWQGLMPAQPEKMNKIDIARRSISKMAVRYYAMIWHHGNYEIIEIIHLKDQLVHGLGLPDPLFVEPRWNSDSEVCGQRWLGQVLAVQPHLLLGEIVKPVDLATPIGFEFALTCHNIISSYNF